MNNTKHGHMSRRHFMQKTALVAGALALGAESAFAQQAGKIVVGTWGGDYARLLTKNIEDPLLKPKGFEIVQDQ